MVAQRGRVLPSSSSRTRQDAGAHFLWRLAATHKGDNVTGESPGQQIDRFDLFPFPGNTRHPTPIIGIHQLSYLASPLDGTGDGSILFTSVCLSAVAAAVGNFHFIDS